MKLFTDQDVYAKTVRFLKDLGYDFEMEPASVADISDEFLYKEEVDYYMSLDVKKISILYLNNH